MIGGLFELASLIESVHMIAILAVSVLVTYTLDYSRQSYAMQYGAI